VPGQTTQERQRREEEAQESKELRERDRALARRRLDLAERDKKAKQQLAEQFQQLQQRYSPQAAVTSVDDATEVGKKTGCQMRLVMPVLLLFGLVALAILGMRVIVEQHIENVQISHRQQIRAMLRTADESLLNGQMKEARDKYDKLLTAAGDDSSGEITSEELEQAKVHRTAAADGAQQAEIRAQAETEKRAVADQEAANVKRRELRRLMIDSDPILSDFVDRFPDCRDAMERLSNNDAKRIINVTQLLSFAGKISFREGKYIRDFVYDHVESEH
jgi:hypothetical protein